MRSETPQGAFIHSTSLLPPFYSAVIDQPSQNVSMYEIRIGHIG
jgi:hypothetical protein